MFSTPPRTYLRGASGPRAVDSGNTSSRHRGSGPQSSKGDDHGETHGPKRKDSQRSWSRKDARRRQTSPASTSQSAPSGVEPPTLELTVVGQPARGIQLGMPLNASVVVSQRMPPSSQGGSPDRIDTSRLFGITSLIQERSDGDRIPMEAGSLTGQKTYDSVHDMPGDSARSFERLIPSLVVLGYFSFPGLVIRQAGTFRIRTTLASMGPEGATNLLAVDSDPIKVERGGTGTSSSSSSPPQRRQHRI